MKRTTQPRKGGNLPKSLQHKLNMYGLAAGAAGVSMLALAPPSEAKIVYTKAHLVLPGGHHGGEVKLDINHDGVVDFDVVHSYTASSDTFLSAVRVPNVSTVNPLNMFRRGHNAYSASALPAGAKIGSGDFIRSGSIAEAYGHTSRVFNGGWANGGRGLMNRYLGLKFAIGNKIHYGWVRISVSKFPFAATLTGYAYETIPNKPIIAGKTKGPDVVVAPTTLGDLAAGASGPHRVPFRPQ